MATQVQSADGPETIETQLAALLIDHNLSSLGITVYAPMCDGDPVWFGTSAQAGGKCGHTDSHAEPGVAPTISECLRAAIINLKAQSVAVPDLEPLATPAIAQAGA